MSPENGWTVNVRQPNATNSVTYSSTNPTLTLKNLFCGQTYLVKVKANCNTIQSEFSTEVSFSTQSCNSFQFGSPQNTTQCINEPGGSHCFNLLEINVQILNGNSVSNNFVSYHQNTNDATNDINPLNVSYCLNVGNRVVVARIEDINGVLLNIKSFALFVKLGQFEAQLNPIIQCDLDSNGFISFDLTAVQSFINNTQSITYHSSLFDAEQGINIIANPSNLTLGSGVNAQYFVRAIISGGCDKIYQFRVLGTNNCNASYSCQNATPICTNLNAAFANTTNIASTGSVGCLSSSPNPHWMTLPISSSGSINMQIKMGNNSPSYNNQDVDFILYGPFSSASGNCDSPIGNVVACSYSASATENFSIPNALAGQYYKLMVTNYGNQAGFIVVNGIPGSTGTIDCNGLKFTTFIDGNNNGVKETNEFAFPLGSLAYQKNNALPVNNLVSPNGLFVIYGNLPSNVYSASYSINPEHAAFYNVVVQNFNNLSVSPTITNYNIPVTIAQPYNDVGVFIFSAVQPRPGFVYRQKVFYTNLSPQTVDSGTVSFVKAAALSIVSVSQAGVDTNTNGFTYNFSNLLPFETRSIDVIMQVPTIPTVTAGDFVTNIASITINNIDNLPNNNSFAISQAIINAYDPNDIAEAHKPEILHSSFTNQDYLTYTIRFENTGNASAINVRINEVLDDKLDLTTLTMLRASHDYALERVGSNLNWKFNNILLPVSVANTETGKGYIVYKIKPKPGYAVNDAITASASIYFDFNPAIVTNFYTTKFVSVLNTESFSLNDISVYPNPANDVLNVKWNEINRINKIVLFDVLGKTVYNNKPIGFNSEIDLSVIAPGLYLLEITDENNAKKVFKIIKN